jgi:hypothetical protein
MHIMCKNQPADWIDHEKGCTDRPKPQPIRRQTRENDIENKAALSTAIRDQGKTIRKLRFKEFS